MTDDLTGDIDPQERAALLALGTRLADERPVPRAAFRSSLGAAIRANAPGSRPARLWLRVAGLAGSGAALLGVAALGIGGAGPLAG